MKTSLSLLLLAVTATSTVQAAECTTDELTALQEIDSSAAEVGVCPDTTTVTDTAEYCVSDCVDLMLTMLDAMPDCSSDDVNMKEALQAVVNYCDSGTTDTSDVITDSSSLTTSECTTDELLGISEIYSVLQSGTSSCPDMTMVTDTAEYCFSDCLDLLSETLDSIPNCSSDGVSMREDLQAAIDYCDSGTADTSGAFTDSASSALTSDSSSLFTSDSSGSSTETSSSSGTSLLRTASPSTDSSSDKATADTQAPSAGSSSASALTAVSSVALAAAAFVIATAL